jgi:hypothetical protein
MVHPVPADKNRDAINALVNGTLKATGTWEAELTKAGQAASNDDEKATFKKEAWTGLIAERKIGYFALLRNLRNIITDAPEAVPAALQMLTDERLIRKSLVLPFRFLTAYDELQKMQSGKLVRDAMVAVNKAIDISVKNVPVFDGETLVVLDISGSMQGRPADIGSVFSAVLLKACNADFMVFSESAEYRNINPADTTLTIAKNIRFSNGGTNFNAIFQKASRKYDRIIILSDMQGWIGNYSPVAEYNKYRKRWSADPVIYSFDLAGHGSMQFPERNINCMAGFSDKVFDVMKLLETDKNALVEKINSVSFS